MSAYDSIKQGLSEALAFAEGKEAGARTQQVEVPAVDVAAIQCQAPKPDSFKFLLSSNSGR